MGEARTALAPAKLNLFLEVMGKRSDGFHELVTVMQTLELADTLAFHPRTDGAVRITCSDHTLPTDMRNLVVKAARMLAEESPRLVGGVDITLTKAIPSGAGLGGGSSDAATTLMVLNDMWNCDLSTEKLSAIAASMGSDIPFFLNAPYALCEGRGEKVTRLEGSVSFPVVLVLPGVHVSTPQVYRSGKIELESERKTHDFRANPIPSESGWQPFNRLQATCFAVYPEVGRLVGVAEAACNEVHALLCGSGSTFAFLCEDEEEADDVEAKLVSAMASEPGTRVLRTRTCSS